MTFTDVRCRGCLRRVGVSRFVNSGMYCDERCAADIPASENEFRDHVLELLSAMGTDRNTLAAYFSISRQRLHQIISRRRLTLRKEPA